MKNSAGASRNSQGFFSPRKTASWLVLNNRFIHFSTKKNTGTYNCKCTFSGSPQVKHPSKHAPAPFPILDQLFVQNPGDFLSKIKLRFQGCWR